MSNVSNLVKTIQDIMRKDAGTYGDAQRLEQLGWMFFLKIFDDREKVPASLQSHMAGSVQRCGLCGVRTCGIIGHVDFPDLPVRWN